MSGPWRSRINSKQHARSFKEHLQRYGFSRAMGGLRKGLFVWRVNQSVSIDSGRLRNACYFLFNQY